MKNDNPIILEIYTCLKNSKDSLSLYEIMKSLEDIGFDLSQSSNNFNNAQNDSENLSSHDLALFRKNFIVMNALYQLKMDLKDTGYTLFISSLKIVLLEEIASIDCELIDKSEGDEKLSQYYLNWDNFYSTNEEVDDLLNSFWDKYNQCSHKNNCHDKKVDALQVLGVDSLASWEDTQHAYRHLIKVFHPDKGGDSAQFIKIREAYLILKFTQNMDQ